MIPITIITNTNAEEDGLAAHICQFCPLASSKLCLFHFHCCHFCFHFLCLRILVPLKELSFLDHSVCAMGVCRHRHSENTNQKKFHCCSQRCLEDCWCCALWLGKPHVDSTMLLQQLLPSLTCLMQRSKSSLISLSFLSFCCTFVTKLQPCPATPQSSNSKFMMFESFDTSSCCHCVVAVAALAGGKGTQNK